MRKPNNRDREEDRRWWYHCVHASARGNKARHNYNRQYAAYHDDYYDDGYFQNKEKHDKFLLNEALNWESE